MNNLIPTACIASKIYLIRGQKVMLDRDLAELYGVKTFVLNQAVKRNRLRFPPDFMFPLTRQEIFRISQFVISSSSIKFSKNVNVFTEQGIAMLSGILNSKRAILVNIAIMRAFVNIRRVLESHKALSEKFEELEKQVGHNKKEIQAIFQAIRQLMAPEEEKPKKIGFLRQ